jgi:hypothetical protein
MTRQRIAHRVTSTRGLLLLLTLLCDLFMLTPASAQIAPPQVTMAYTPSTIVYNGLTILTFVLSNPNAGTTLTGVAFTDDAGVAMVIIPATSPSPVVVVRP